MGTVGCVVFCRKSNNKPLVAIRSHFDGYIDGLGHALAEWLLEKTIVNGIGADQNTFEYANGVGCLAAQFVRRVKDEVGGWYITDLDSLDSWDYVYEVVVNDSVNNPTPIDNICTVIVKSYGEKIFEGKPSELLNFDENRGNKNDKLS